MVAEAPVACLVLAAAMMLLAGPGEEDAKFRTFQSSVWPLAAANVCEALAAPANTLSNTSSLPMSPVRPTLMAVLEVDVLGAPTAAPSGVV